MLRICITLIPVRIRILPFHFDADPDPACHFDADPDPQHGIQIPRQDPNGSVLKNGCGSEQQAFVISEVSLTPLFSLYSAHNTQKLRSFWASLLKPRTPELFANVGNICWWKICLSSCKTLQNLAFSIFYVSLLRILAPFPFHFLL